MAGVADLRWAPVAAGCTAKKRLTEIRFLASLGGIAGLRLGACFSLRL